MLNVVRSPCSPQNVVLHVRYTQISISVNILSSSTRQSTRVARLSETPRRHRQTRTPGGRCIAAKSAVRPVPLSLSGACFYVLANWVAQRCTQLPRHGARPREEPVDGSGRLGEADRGLLSVGIVLVLVLYEESNRAVNMKCERVRASTIRARFWHRCLVRCLVVVE